MLTACSLVKFTDLDSVHKLVKLFGREFWIRDDYTNLVSSEVAQYLSLYAGAFY